MDYYHHGVSAMGYAGSSRYDFTGLLDRVPMPVLAIVLAVLAITVFGMISRIGSILKGEGTAVDYMGMVVILVLLTLVAIIMLGGGISGVKFF